VYYYMSMKTGECRLLEPPTGASLIVYRADLERKDSDGKFVIPFEVRQFARWPMSNVELRSIPENTPNLEAFFEREEGEGGGRHKLSRRRRSSKEDGKAQQEAEEWERAKEHGYEC